MFFHTLTYTSAVIYFAVISPYGPYSAGLRPFCGPIVIVLKMYCFTYVFINFVLTSCFTDCDIVCSFCGSNKRINLT